MESLAKSTIDQLLQHGEPSRKEFIERYIDRWEVTPREIRLSDLAEQYHAECEAYDKTVCTAISPYDGHTAMPIGRWQENRVTENAHKTYQLLSVQAQREGYSKDEFRRAVQAFRPMERLKK